MKSNKILFFTIIGFKIFTQCHTPKSLPTTTKIAVVEEEAPDDKVTLKLLQRDLPMLIKAYRLQSNNVMHIRKANPDDFIIKVMGSGYAKDGFTPNEPRILEGVSSDTIFTRQAAKLADELGCIHIYSGDAGLTYYVIKGKKCE